MSKVTIQWMTGFKLEGVKFPHPTKNNVKRVREEVSKLDKGKLYLVTVTEHVDDRTKKQNAYLHLIIKQFRDILKDTGTTLSDHEAKHYLKLMTGFYTEVREKDGSIHKIPKESHKLKKDDFAEWIDVIQSFFWNRLGVEMIKPYWDK